MRMTEQEFRDECMVRLKGLALAGEMQTDRLAVQPEVQKRGPLHHAVP